MNLGIPGTGLTSRSRLSGTAQPVKRQQAVKTMNVSMICAVLEDGTLSFTDSTGLTVSEQTVEAAKKQNRDAILELIQRKCDEINEQTEALGRLHYDTPSPLVAPRFVTSAFPEAVPLKPTIKALGLLGRFVPGRRRKVEEVNRAAHTHHQKAVENWEAEKATFEYQGFERKKLLEYLIYEDVAAMERYLEESLNQIVWPRETLISFDIRDNGSVVALDVDLPEVEDMPNRFATVPSRGLKLSVKELSSTKVQKLYAEHIHGIVFRLVGEVFAALPNVSVVMASGYSQRRNPANAQLRDDYLISVRATRQKWSVMDFSHLESLDVTEALSQFDLQRDMSKAGLLKSIMPHE